MPGRSVSDFKEYAAQMLHEDETDTVLAGSTSEGTHNLIERWLQKSLGRAWNWHHWSFLTDTIDLAWSGQSSGTNGIPLYLPDYIGKILSIYPQSSTRSVGIMRAFPFNRQRPNIRSRDVLVLHGSYGVEADMPSAGTVTATSSASAADDGLQVRLEGLTSGSPQYRQTETLTLSGGTATSTNSFASGVGGLIKAYIVPSTTAYTGVVTVTRGSTTLERLDASWEIEHQHIRTELYAPLGGTGTYTVQYYRRPPDPRNASDVIDIPEDFADVIELGMMKEMARFRGNYQEAMGIEQEWKQRMSELRGWDNSQPGERRRVTLERQWGRGRRFWRA